ncbi:unnamed protein product [Porites evermanni]|uniref:Uncharacterized protein n=1 Tax=Porites evermanni TaxID=104178 RepID=A0ABN8M526_9CNID|nr:unnamed protein product [Porites evermanni]
MCVFVGECGSLFQCQVVSERGLTTTQIPVIQDERHLSSATISSYISSFSTQSNSLVIFFYNNDNDDDDDDKQTKENKNVTKQSKEERSM